MNNSTYKGILTKFTDNKDFFYTYIDTNNSIYEIKKATYKKYKDIIVLNGNSKDNFILLFNGIDNKVFIELTSNYSKKDKLFFYHLELTKNNLDTIKSSLKTCFIKDKLNWVWINENIKDNIAITDYNSEGFQIVKQFTNTQLDCIDRITNNLKNELCKQTINNCIASYKKDITELLTIASKYNNEKLETLEKIANENKKAIIDKQLTAAAKN